MLVLAWERFLASAAVAAGRDPALIDDGELWATCILEVEPRRPSGGSIVWEWHLWDHLIQDLDPLRANYGDVAAHPELVDLNFAQGGHKDWTHGNAVDFSADLDQIALSIHNFGELWIIDHSTTTAEAAGHGGGDQGRGGDLLYRWGNPRAWRAGDASDQQLFGQHDVQWISAGLSGAGNMLIYNNGMGRPDGEYSSILEIAAPVGADGSYALTAGGYGPMAPAWEYVADPPESFYSHHISGVQRLESGNTLICCGADGWFFEVTPAGQIVWEYMNPHADSAAVGNSVFRATRYEADYPGLADLN